LNGKECLLLDPKNGENYTLNPPACLG
jgi:hypothetical protein